MMHDGKSETAEQRDSAPWRRSYRTAREHEVVQLLAEGKSTKEVACHLNLSVKTAENPPQHHAKTKPAFGERIGVVRDSQRNYPSIDRAGSTG